MNKTILMGNVGSDPHYAQTQAGTAVANLSLATNRRWKDSNGQKQEKTEWHRLVFFGPLADVVRNHVSKGSKILVEGRSETRKWQDQQGNDRYTTEVICGELEILTWPDGDRQQNDNYEGFDDDLPF